ncbi:MAG TPA: glycoside hydrolase family 3 N-terminal domain-containing protein [archaeon]|nr:glycoside hydrolase family 3 N-terminal domain-containing protein [archaeon]
MRNSAWQLTVLLGLILFFTNDCRVYGQNKTAPAPYLNPKLAVSERVADLVNRMTLEEKIGQMNQYIAPLYAKSSEPQDFSNRLNELLRKGLIGSFLFVTDCNEANELQRIAENSCLRIPLIFGIDAVHGLCPVQGTTIFPAPIGMGGTFDPELVEKASAITAKETRATGMHWAFYPVLGVGRDPRWGRTGETFGEDPYLVSQMGMAVVKGFQGQDLSSPDNIIACVKHFAAHSSPLGGRNIAPMEVSERTLRTVFLPPFEAAIRQGAFSVMAAYHENNGIPCHASEMLLTKILRGEWGFKGFIVSDWGGIEMLVSRHRVAETQKEAVRQAVTAGIDMHMQGDGFTEPLLELVTEGVISRERIDESVSRILTAKFRLGLFENKYVDPKMTAQVLACKEHQEKALEVARKALVLLENRNGILPLSKEIKSILVTGPCADNNALMGDWAAPQPGENVITVLEGIKDIVSSQTQVRYVDCGKIWEETPERIGQAAQAAEKADVAVVVVGGNDARYDDLGNFNRGRKERTGGEGVDRADLSLAGGQLDLVKAVYNTGTPTVVVLINGRPLAVEWIAENIPAVLEAWEPGMRGGKAVAEALFGDYNPGGRLSISIPRCVGQLPVWYNHPPSAENDYKYTTYKPLYPFGYGLSYTKFDYSNLRFPATVPFGRNIEISVEVTNSGERAGDEVVLLYVNDLVSSVTTPVKELKGFKRITLRPGETQTVGFNLLFDQLAFLDREMKKIVEPGRFAVMIGNLRQEFEVLKR